MLICPPYNYNYTTSSVSRVWTVLLALLFNYQLCHSVPLLTSNLLREPHGRPFPPTNPKKAATGRSGHLLPGDGRPVAILFRIR